jgi:hypothetical protein
LARTVLDHALARVAAVRAEISRINSPDVAPPSRRGLELIDLVFLDLHTTLTEDVDGDNDPDSVKAVAEDTLQALDLYLPLIGFMLRSTNVRNAFELHGPLVRMARHFFGPQTNVVLSSEWEFSPFIYRPIVDLPDFVLIGLPASESGNGLIVPLAGHELGHAIYERREVRTQIEDPVATALVAAIDKRWDEYTRVFPDLDKKDLSGPQGRRTWEPFFERAVDQCEESFCDFLGLRLFGESYLHAFAYLLAPCLRLRSLSYPSMMVRVANLVSASVAFGVPVPAGFQNEFRDSREDFLPPEKLFCSLADEALAIVVPLLVDQVKTLATECAIPERDEADIQGALGDFKLVIPARKASSLATIVNAGWMAYHDASLWSAYPDVVKRRGEVLNDLVLKSAEIFEIRERLLKTVPDA